MTYQQAESDCQEMNATLAGVHSEEEQDFLLSTLIGRGSLSFPIVHKFVLHHKRTYALYVNPQEELSVSIYIYSCCLVGLSVCLFGLVVGCFFVSLFL